MRGAWRVVATAAPVHVGLALATDLSPDEAYYLCAGRLGRIPDHPPLVPWVLGALDHLHALPVELRVRLLPLVTSAAIALGVAYLVRARGGSSRASTVGAALATWLPLPLAGGFVATPDGLALLAVIAALAWAGTATPSRTLTASTALLVGAGVLAKVVILPVAVAIAVVGSRRRWSRLAWVAPAALAVPLAVPSLRFQLVHAYVSPGWSAGAALGAAVALVLGSLALWSPAVVVPAAGSVRALPLADRATLAIVSALVLGSALVRAVPPELNWWAPAALVVVVAAALAMDRLRPQVRRALVAIAITPSIVLATHVVRPWLPIARAYDPTARLHGWTTADPPVDAPGTGTYALAAERCVYAGSCDEITSIIRGLNDNASGYTFKPEKR